MNDNDNRTKHLQDRIHHKWGYTDSSYGSVQSVQYMLIKSTTDDNESVIYFIDRTDRGHSL